ncbi:hypothetical protein QQS21_000358 [Conoideocrella luteorostrata]|uniref:Fe2OG dioxygenase domain-containing protein n=1 Tax=Conoideocrella luteorostrata TaxID=1105319 RepID=A0AAJ0G2V1_9HYPO|nr:hypothetical protein QQS21_000358 [Conoideocrella luteorostrata]
MPALYISQASHPIHKAPPVVGPRTKKVTRPKTDVPTFLIEDAQNVRVDTWDPDRHVCFQAPTTITTMKDIGLEGHGISTTAVSDTFPLFSRDAMLQMRREMFSPEVLQNCRYSSDYIANMIRGMGPSRASFTYDAWYSPEVLDKISQVAGIELVPAFDFEVANINISINDQNADVVTYGDHTSEVAWHYDSFPFVCVTMVSDCSGMIGGETAIKLPNGDVRKARGPAMGTAIVMQGRLLEDVKRERIAMVTPLRPKNPLIRDETILTGVRATSNLEELYSQYTEYRFEVLEERFRSQLKNERRRKETCKGFDIEEIRAFITEQKEYLESMLEQMYKVE